MGVVLSYTGLYIFFIIFISILVIAINIHYSIENRLTRESLRKVEKNLKKLENRLEKEIKRVNHISH